MTKKIIKGLKILFTQGLGEVINKVKSKLSQKKQALSINQRYQIWFSKNYPDLTELKKQKTKSKKFKYQPKISIITPVYNTPEKFLRECIESVINQSYGNWELCITDDASTKLGLKNILEEYKKKDKRIKVFYRKENGHICRASNAALKLATGEFVGLLDHDDILWPNALYEVVKLLNNKPSSQFVYSDEDKLEEDGKTHIDPFFKPDWSPDYLRSINYITHFIVIKKKLIDKVGGFRVGCEGSQDWDIFLRITRELEKHYNCHSLDQKGPIQHIPTILYSWRKSSQSTASEKYVANKDYAYQNQKKVLEDDLKSSKYRGKIFPSPFLGLWNIQYKIKKNSSVSIIIPTVDHYDLILKCLNSILKKTTYKNYEIIIVDTGSKNKNVWSLYEEIKTLHPQTQILQWNKLFNFSAVCNYATQKSGGEYLVFLNNDTEILTGEWLEIMLGYAQQPHIGSVGMKLVYPDGKIQHAGIVFYPKNKLDGMILPDHAYKNYQDGYDYGMENSGIYGVKDYLAVTGACMMIKTKIFNKINGFNEQFQVAFNDVDLGIKLNKNSLYNISINWLKTLHYESKTIKKPEEQDRDQKTFVNELKLLHNSWHNIIIKDPFLNKYLFYDSTI